MKQIKAIEKKINDIKKELMSLGDMHPGSLSKQWNVCGDSNCRCKDETNPQKHGPYHSLSYTLRGRSTSRFIREEHVKLIEEQIANHKKFKDLTMEWKNLAGECAKLKLDLAKSGK